MSRSGNVSGGPGAPGGRRSFRPLRIVAGAGLVFVILLVAIDRTGAPTPGSPSGTAGKGILRPPAANAPAPANSPRNGARPGSSSGLKAPTPPSGATSPRVASAPSPVSAGPIPVRPAPQVNPDDLPPGHPPITPDDGSEVGIQWLGYSCFYIHSPGGIAVVTDPFDPKATGLKAPDTGAHFVTVSDDTPEHDGADQVHSFRDEQGHQLVKRVLHGTAATQGDLKVTPFPTGSGNIAYVIQAGPLRIVHLGDLRHPLAPEEVRALGAVDVLMIPAGGPGLKPSEAAALTKEINPRVVLPMSYRIDDSSGAAARLRPLQEFISATAYAVTARDSDVTLLSKASLPSSTEIYTLRYLR